MNVSSRAYRLLRRLYGELLARRHTLRIENPKSSSVEIENLEARLLLSTYTVDSLEDISHPDDGLTTLREAVVAANAAPGMDRIELSDKLARRRRNSCELLEGPITISDDIEVAIAAGKTLTLESAAGQSALIVEGADSYTINVTLDGVCVDGRGGTLLTAQHAKLNVIHANLTGGAVGLSATDSQINLYNSVIAENSDGGLNVDACTVSIRGSLIEDNGSDEGHGGLAATDSAIGIAQSILARNTGALAGGLLATGSTVNINDSSVIQNVHGGLRIESSTAEIARTLIKDNSNNAGGGLDIVDSTVSLSDCRILDNRANRTTVASPVVLPQFLFEDSSELSTNVTISNTMPPLETLIDLRHGGGGIHADNSTLAITGGRISGNTLECSTIGILCINAHEAGAGAGIAAYDSQTTLNGVTVSRNTTTRRSMTSLAPTVKGLGIYVSGGEIELADSAVTENYGFAGLGAGVYAANAVMRIENSSLSRNRLDGGGSSGGGLFADAAQVDIINSSITGNRIQGSGDISGAGIHASGGTLNITGSELSTNALVCRDGLAMGGGLYASDLELAVADSAVVGNSIKAARVNGGGLGVYSCTGVIESTLISANVITAPATTTFQGAGAVLTGPDLSLINSVVVGNTAKAPAAMENVGGALYLADVTVVHSTIADNRTLTRSGTAILAWDATINNSILWNNRGPDATIANLQSGGMVTLNNSLVGMPGSADEGINGFIPATNNILGDNDPCFENPGAGDYAIRFNSPAKDAGDTALAVYADATPLATDFPGNPRFVNAVDIGAYEHQSGPGGVSSDGSDDDGGRVIAFSAGNPAVFHDFAGQPVRIVLRGPGRGELFLPAQDYCYPDLIAVTDSTRGTSLIVHVAGRDSTQIGSINLDGDAARILAGPATLTGNIDVGGSLGLLRLGDTVVGHQEITINSAEAADETAPAMKVFMGSIADVAFHAGDQGIAGMKLQRWVDTADSVADSLSAAWIGSLRATGGYDDSEPDFQADITLSGHGAARGVALKKFVAADMSDAQVTVGAGSIQTVDVQNWIGGGIEAPAMDRFAVEGTVRGITARLTRQDFFSDTLGQADIGGYMTNSQWRIAGDIGRFNVARGLESSEILTGGSIGRLEAGRILDVTLLAGLPMDFAGDHGDSVAQFTGLRGPSATIYELLVTGEGFDTGQHIEPWGFIITSPGYFSAPSQHNSLVNNLSITAGVIGEMELINLHDANPMPLTMYVPFSETNIGSITHTDGRDWTRSFTWTPGEQFPQWLDSPLTILPAMNIG